MRKTKISVTIIFVLLLLLSSFFLYRKNAQEKIPVYQLEINYYQSIIHHEQAWLDSTQLDNGAYPFRPLVNNRADVNPYFSSMAAYSLLLGNTFYSDNVYEYMAWLFTQLNTSSEDPYQIDGTLSNIRMTQENGQINEEKFDYDSVDSYTALFIILLNYAYDTDPRYEFYQANEGSIIRLFKALLSTRAENGLSYVSVGNKTQYTMDNVEVNYAIKKGINLLNNLLELSNNQELKEIQIELEEWLIDNTQAIETILWNPAQQKYRIAIDKNGNEVEFKSWDNFYPDAMAQLFPIVFNVIEPDSERAKEHYIQFVSNYSWEDFKFREGFYWTVVSTIGAMMDDTDRVKTYLDYYQEHIMSNHDYPIYNAEVAWIIQTCQIMINKYEDKIDQVDPLKLFH